MCMLTYLPGDTQPDLDALLNGVLCNDHGHGYAVVDDDRVIVGRGMDATAVIDEFAHVRRELPAGPALFHSRWATHGTLSEDNCHPFVVGDDPRTVLAHNGVLPTEVQPVVGDTRSDTRIAAEDFLPRKPFGSLGSQRGRRRVEKWLRRDKLLILTVDPSYRSQAILLNEDRGVWHDGIWYSNLDFLPPAPTPRLAADSIWDLETLPGDLADVGTECLTCEQADSVYSSSGICSVCRCCVLCTEPMEYCECRVSTAQARITAARWPAVGDADIHN